MAQSISICDQIAVHLIESDKSFYSLLHYYLQARIFNIYVLNPYHYAFKKRKYHSNWLYYPEWQMDILHSIHIMHIFIISSLSSSLEMV